MLRSLQINNIALIRSASLDIGSGLTVFTGETGAGKSLLIDSIEFILGAKADRSLITHGQDKAVVRALFDVGDRVAELVREQGYDCDEGELLIARTLTQDGKSDIRLNGKPTSLSILREITSHIVDVHGQHEHQSLLKTATHVAMVDKLGGKETEKAKAEVAERFEAVRQVNKAIEALGGSDAERARAMDILRFQIDELTDAALSAEEEAELQQKLVLAQNREKLTLGLNQAMTDLNGHGDALGNLSRGAREIDALSRFDERFSALAERVNSAYLDLQDVFEDLRAYLDENEIDEKEIDRITERAETYKKMKRKYGGTTEAVLQFLSDSQRRLSELENCEQTLADLHKQLSDANAAYAAAAKRLREQRKRTAKSLVERVRAGLVELCMGDVTFSVEIEDAQPSSNGSDHVEFFLSTNKGEPAKPLAKIVSGGEMSRFMLTMKVLTAEFDEIDTMIFDEIDNGISGKVGEAVARKLGDLGRTHQVLCISHLPFIAAMADDHLRIRKDTVGDHTETFVEKLDRNGMIGEISRLVGGEELSSFSLSHSSEIKDWCDRYKAKKKN